MTAHDNLSPQQFFHGTRHTFKPGDELTPQKAVEHANYGETDHDYVYAHPDNVQAYKFASMADQHKAQAAGDKTGAPRTYEVAPMGDVEPDEDYEGEQGSVRSRAGFRVIRQNW